MSGSGGTKVAIKFSDRFTSREPTTMMRRAQAAAKQREEAAGPRLRFKRNEQLRIRADEVRQMSKVQVSGGEITLRHKSLAAGTHHTGRQVSGTIVKVDSRRAIIELAGRSTENLKSQLSVPTRRLVSAAHSSQAGLTQGTKVLVNVAREPEVEPAKRVKVSNLYRETVNPTPVRWLNVSAAPATAARRPSEVALPLRNPTNLWRVRPAQMKMEKYIGTVKATEDDEVLASVTPEGNIDTREVYIPVSSFERPPRPGEKFEYMILSGSGFTATNAKILRNVSLPKLEDFGLSAKVLKERVSKITFGRSDD